MWASILSEWASLIFRWLHVIAAIGWIGSSFYFIHLDLELKPRSDLPEGASAAAGSFTWSHWRPSHLEHSPGWSSRKIQIFPCPSWHRGRSAEYASHRSNSGESAAGSRPG